MSGAELALAFLSGVPPRLDFDRRASSPSKTRALVMAVTMLNLPRSLRSLGAPASAAAPGRVPVSALEELHR